MLLQVFKLFGGKTTPSLLLQSKTIFMFSSIITANIPKALKTNDAETKYIYHQQRVGDPQSYFAQCIEHWLCPAGINGHHSKQ